MTPVPLPPLKNQEDYSESKSFGGHNRRFSQHTFDANHDIDFATPSRELRSSAMGIYEKDKSKKRINYESTKISQRGSGVTIAGPLGSDTR